MEVHVHVCYMCYTYYPLAVTNYAKQNAFVDDFVTKHRQVHVYMYMYTVYMHGDIRVSLCGFLLVESSKRITNRLHEVHTCVYAMCYVHG